MFEFKISFDLQRNTELIERKNITYSYDQINDAIAICFCFVRIIDALVFTKLIDFFHQLIKDYVVLFVQLLRKNSISI